MWKATHRAVRAVAEGEGHSLAVAVWARQLRSVRERTVFEMHLSEAAGPLWAGAATGAPRALRRLPARPGAPSSCARRARSRNARVSKADHDLA